MNTATLRTHWFLLAAPVILAADVWASIAARGGFTRVLEAGLLFDLVLVVPGLYALCYRGRGRRALLRATWLACLGLWAALQLVPAADRQLIDLVAPLRYVGLAALAWLELRLVLAVYQSVFKGGTVDQAAARAGDAVPPWLARVMALEAGLWLKAWRALRRLLRR